MTLERCTKKREMSDIVGLRKPMVLTPLCSLSTTLVSLASVDGYHI